jgi:hypothetical protein
MERAEQADEGDRDYQLARAQGARGRSLSAVPAEKQRRLQQDANGGFERTTAANEPDGLVQVDVAVRRDHHRARPCVPGVRELFHSPPNDALVFGFVYENRFDCRRHRSSDRPLGDRTPSF